MTDTTDMKQPNKKCAITIIHYGQELLRSSWKTSYTKLKMQAGLHPKEALAAPPMQESNIIFVFFCLLARGENTFRRWPTAKHLQDFTVFYLKNLPNQTSFSFIHHQLQAPFFCWARHLGTSKRLRCMARKIKKCASPEKALDLLISSLKGFVGYSAIFSSTAESACTADDVGLKLKCDSGKEDLVSWRLQKSPWSTKSIEYSLSFLPCLSKGLLWHIMHIYHVYDVYVFNVSQIDLFKFI